MIKNEILEIAQLYFFYFEKKDINSLSKLFSKEIILFDPIVKSVVGIENVLLANREIFRSTNTITIISKRIFIDHFTNTIIAELKIDFDKKIVNVVDIITLDSENKISSITAYLDSKQIIQ
jgi:hypothetical protein